MKKVFITSGPDFQKKVEILIDMTIHLYSKTSKIQTSIFKNTC